MESTNVIGNFTIENGEKIAAWNKDARKSGVTMQETYAKSILHSFGNYVLHGGVELLNATYASVVTSYGNGDRAKSFVKLIAENSAITFNTKEGVFKHSKNKVKKGHKNRFDLVSVATDTWYSYGKDTESQEPDAKDMLEYFRTFRKSLNTKDGKGLVSDYSPEVLNKVEAKLKAEVDAMVNSANVSPSVALGQ